jgi:hypothetical protein
LATALSRKGVGSTGKPLALCITYSWKLKLCIELWLRKFKCKKCI